MSQMKVFATQLTEYIYLRGYSEAQIMEIYADLPDDPAHIAWLQAQIKAVQSNPQIYRTLVESEDLHRWKSWEKRA